MKYKSKNWKIIQSDNSEFILLSDSDTIKKIKGNNANDIVSVLLNIQNNKKVHLQEDFLLDKFENEYVENIQEWLLINEFVYLEKSKNLKINIVGEFGNKNSFINEFKQSLPDNIFINKIYDLSNPTILNDFEDSFFTLIIAPLYYNKYNIELISNLQIKSKSDFLYVEIYNNGILIGPLMNSQKETVCLNCIEKRRVFNATNPKIIIDNLVEKEPKLISNNNVFQIGNFNINCAFIYNEINKILSQKIKTLYNKSVFIDFNKYDNQFFEVMKAPNCEICNNLTIYNPL